MVKGYLTPAGLSNLCNHFRNGKHTVFGRIVTGFDTLVKLQRVDPDDEKARPVDPDRIVKAELLRKRDHEYFPNKVK